MLLPEESQAIEHLAGALRRRVEPGSELGVFPLQLAHLLHWKSAAANGPRGLFELLHPRLCLQGAPTEPRQLVSQMANELVEFVKGLLFRSLAV